MTSQKNYNYLIDLIGGVWVENNGTQHLKIKDKPYDITFNPRVLEWTALVQDIYLEKIVNTLNIFKRKNYGC